MNFNRTIILVTVVFSTGRFFNWSTTSSPIKVFRQVKPHASIFTSIPNAVVRDAGIKMTVNQAIIARIPLCVNIAIPHITLMYFGGTKISFHCDFTDFNLFRCKPIK